MRAALLLVTVLIVFCAKLQATPFAVYLTWQKDPTTTMTIQWICKKSSGASRVEYKEVDTENWIECKSYSNDLPHHVPYKVYVLEIENLKPNTHYLFRFFRKGHSSKVLILQDEFFFQIIRN